MKKFIFLDWVIPATETPKEKSKEEENSFLPGVPFH
jgi:hypothetical protein